MKNNDLKSVLIEIAEEALPGSDIDLLPTLTRKLAVMKPKNKISLRRFTQGSLLRRSIVTVLALALVFSILLITPQGRAFAQTLFRFFSTAESESFPLPDEELNLYDDTPTPAPTFALSLETVSPPNNNEPIEATPVPLPTSSTVDDVLKNCKVASAMLSYACQIAFAESQVGFDVYEFPTIPRGLSFLEAQSNTTLQLVTIHYGVVEGGGYLTLSQGNGTIPTSKWSDVRANAIEQVKVGEHYGEFAQGQFVVYPGATSATWEANAAVVRLHWSDGNRWYSLEKEGNTAPIEYMDKQFLIDLAASLVKSPSSQANTSLGSGYYLSISEAEASIGFDLLEPYILPEGFEFAYARYDSSEQRVMLFYLPKDQPEGVGGLYIMETPRHASNGIFSCEECPVGTVEQIKINDELAYYWQGVYHTGTDKDPLPTPIWQSDEPHYTLTWMISDLIITLMYSGSEWYGGQISKDNLVQIAESMR